MSQTNDNLISPELLLKAMSEGAPTWGDPPSSGRKVVTYDFRRPSRFSKDHLRALQSIHERFSRNLASALTSHLRLNTRVQLVSVEQAIFDEYVQQLPALSAIYVLSAPPLEGPLVLEMGLLPVLAAFDRLCGGPGAPRGVERELTEIEQALLRALGQNVVPALTDAWTGVAPINPAIAEVVLNSQALRAIAPNEIVAVLLFDFAVGDVSGMLSLCLPYIALESIIDRLHKQAWLVGRRRSGLDGAEVVIRDQLLRTPLEVTVELGEVDLPASAVLSLEVGDVIRLGTPAEGDLRMLVAGRSLFRCRPGLSAGNVAVRIEQVVQEALATRGAS